SHRGRRRRRDGRGDVRRFDVVRAGRLRGDRPTVRIPRDRHLAAEPNAGLTQGARQPRDVRKESKRTMMAQVMVPGVIGISTYVDYAYRSEEHTSELQSRE